MSAYQNNKITLLGCGRWGKNILRDLLSLGCQVAVVDPEPAARVLALEMGASAVYMELAEVSEKQAGYVVATPTITHVAVIESLLDKKCPVFVEKPLASDIKQVKRLAKGFGELVFVMQKWRYHPGVEALAQLASSREFGPLQSMCSRRVQWSHPHKDVDATWILAPHDMAIVQHIMGELPQVRFACGEQVGNRLESLLVVLGDGPTAVIEISSLRPQSDRLIVVRLEQAVASLNNPLSDHIEIRRVSEKNGAIADSLEKRSISTEYPLLRELRVFLAFLNGGPAPPSTLYSEIAIVKAILDARSLADPSQSIRLHTR